MPSTKKHLCNLDIGSDSMLNKKDGKGGICHVLKKSTLIAVEHPSSKLHFVSYAAVVAERQRHVVEGGRWIIHPYSMFSLIWRSFMVGVNLAFIVWAPLNFSYKLPMGELDRSFVDYLLLIIKVVCLLDIVIVFNTGYRDKSETYIVIKRSRIVYHYLLRWFFPDLASCLPVAFISSFCPEMNSRYRMFMTLVPCLRCAKIFHILKDFKVFIKIFKVNFIFRRCIRLVLVFLITLHWCSCLLYMAALINFHWYGKPPVGYANFLDKFGGITGTTVIFRYKKAVLIACAGFFGIHLGWKCIGTGFTTFRATNPDEMMTNALVVICGQLFMLYTLALFLRIYITYHNSRLKYQELLNQVEKYMQHKQFPTQMKNRVREFYRYKFQERYYREKMALECLSEQLRNEIFLDKCHKLIEKVSLFEGLPASVVSSVLGCLHPEVYMPNDLIVRAGDVGNCMYFISCGTVAVYSLKGAEVCHLDDGDYFGEVALLMKDRKRIVTIVAIEITQLYRLDQQDFRDFIMTYQEMYERIEALASKRMHETVLIDEQHKTKFPI